MPLPRSLARFNRVTLNRVMRHFNAHVAGFGVVHHRGRTSGRPYATPVNVFRRPGGFAIPLTYGTESEWVQNVLAAGNADITIRRHDHHVTNPRLVHAPRPVPVPGPVAAILRRLDVEDFLLVDDASGR
jgi:deazaflavin-dependent oxidoreductase (nitroreductase family)